jgi:hypothetical protein
MTGAEPKYEKHGIGQVVWRVSVPICVVMFFATLILPNAVRRGLFPELISYRDRFAWTLLINSNGVVTAQIRELAGQNGGQQFIIVSDARQRWLRFGFVRNGWDDPRSSFSAYTTIEFHLWPIMFATGIPIVVSLYRTWKFRVITNRRGFPVETETVVIPPPPPAARIPGSASSAPRT